LWRNVLFDEGKNIAKHAEREHEAGNFRRAKNLYIKAIAKFGQASDISGDFNEISVLRSLSSYYIERVHSIEQELLNDPEIDTGTPALVNQETSGVDVSELLRGSGVQEEVFGTVLRIAMEISREGREGHAIGTAFLVGDEGNVMARSKQLVLNPFEGHKREKIKLTDADIGDNIKEFAQLDGVFVVSGDGVVEAAGRYITMDTGMVRIPRGLGTRHSSVAAVTLATKALGVVVSQSGGVIRIFKDGKIVATIKP
jgi:DNA integrity scanning protein DisA with diadenylate cyclase activity